MSDIPTNGNSSIVTYIDKFFKLKQKKTSIKTEFLAGLTTFFSMAYIIFVVPSMLSAAGMPKDAALASCLLTTALCTIYIGIYANYPVAVAPGMGLTAFFAFYVCGSQHLPWQTALGAVFISGIIFFILSVTKIRQLIIDAVPPSLKTAIVVGIGCFISFIGLQGSGIIVADPATKVTLGDLTSINVILTLFGILFTAALISINVKAAILIGIVVVTIISMIIGNSAVPSSMADVFSFEIPNFAGTFMQMDLIGALHYGIISIIFTFTIVELFDTIGTLIAVTKMANMVDENGKIENIDKALISDSVGTIASAAIGTCTVATYVESATGINAGGRTGLTAVFVGLLFLLGFFITPLGDLIPACATAPALIIVGGLMVSNISSIDFKDFSEGFPAFLTIIMMPLTYSIANGFAFGFLSYCFIKVFSGKFKEISPTMWGITIFLAVSFFLR